MGHINLVVPVAHIWYFRSLPNKIGYLLGLPSKKLDMIIYYERYVVIQPGIATGPDGEEIQKMDFLTEEEYLNILETIPPENQYLEDSDPNKFIAKMGAECLIDLLSRIDLKELSYELRHKANTETSKQRKTEALKRLQVVEALRESQDNRENLPEWMIMKVIPVIPPELRPLVPLDGGRFATSDLNGLYRRVIIRNNRLKRLMEIKAPEVIPLGFPERKTGPVPSEPAWKTCGLFRPFRNCSRSGDEIIRVRVAKRYGRRTVQALYHP